MLTLAYSLLEMERLVSPFVRTCTFILTDRARSSACFWEVR